MHENKFQVTSYFHMGVCQSVSSDFTFSIRILQIGSRISDGEMKVLAVYIQSYTR